MEKDLFVKKNDKTFEKIFYTISLSSYRSRYYLHVEENSKKKYKYR